MNKKELIKKLVEEKFNMNYFSLNNEDNEMTLVLRKEDKKWLVYFCERGERWGIKYITTEEEACILFYERAQSMPKLNR